MQLFHPNGGNAHIELVANELAPENTGGGLVNVTERGCRKAHSTLRERVMRKINIKDIGLLRW